MENEKMPFLKPEKRILILLILLIICLIICTITFSFASLNSNKNKTVTTTVSSTTQKTQYNKTTSEINKDNNIITTKTNNTTKTTSEINDITKTTTTTQRITTKNNIGIKEEIIEDMYYYKWTEDEERDFTGRNCLFLYDDEGKIVDGYVNILYYNKYTKEQYITDDTNNCFLEDKFSVEILYIKKDDKIYE